MEVTVVAGVVGTALAGACVGLAFSPVYSACAETMKSVRARARIRQGDETRSEEQESLPERLQAMATMLLEGGIPAFRKASAFLLRSGFVSKHLKPLVSLANAHGYAATPTTLMECLIPCALLVVLLAAAVAGSLAVGVVVCVALAMVIAMVAEKRASERDEKILEELPDALNAIGVYYESGLTLMQAFEQASEEVQQPLAGMLGGVSEDMKAGKSVDEALARLRESSDIKAISFVTVAMEIQQRTGGALQPLLEGAAKSVSESLEMERFLEVKTAQSRLSARIVSLLPVILLLVMAMVSPSYITGFFDSTFGMGVFLVAVSLEAIGVILVRKILDVDFGR